MTVKIRELRTLGFVLICLFPVPSRAEAMSEQEARALLQQVRNKHVEPGCYRTIATTAKSHGVTTTTTVLLRYDAEGRRFSRTEVVRSVEGRPRRTKTRLTVQNQEGLWNVYPHHAVLMPMPVDRQHLIEAAKAMAMQQRGDANAPQLSDTQDPEARRFVQLGLTLMHHTHCKAEQIEDGKQPLVRVIQTYDEEAARALRQMVDEQIAKMKKDLSFGMRMIASAVLATKDLDELIPVREDYVINPQEMRIVETSSYNRTGKLIRNQKPNTPERIADLPPDTFALPTGIELHRPPSLAKALELVQKIEKEEKASAEKGPKDDM